MAIYFNDGTKVRNASQIYMGIGGVPKKIQSIYYGINGRPKLIYGGEDLSISIISSKYNNFSYIYTKDKTTTEYIVNVSTMFLDGKAFTSKFKTYSSSTDTTTKTLYTEANKILFQSTNRLFCQDAITYNLETMILDYQENCLKLFENKTLTHSKKIIKINLRAKQLNYFLNNSSSDKNIIFYLNNISTSNTQCFYMGKNAKFRNCDLIFNLNGFGFSSSQTSYFRMEAGIDSDRSEFNSILGIVENYNNCVEAFSNLNLNYIKIKFNNIRTLNGFFKNSIINNGGECYFYSLSPTDNYKTILDNVKIFSNKLYLYCESQIIANYLRDNTKYIVIEDGQTSKLPATFEEGLSKMPSEPDKLYSSYNCIEENIIITYGN